MEQKFEAVLINLKHRTDRREKITKQLNDRKIDFKLFEAINGKELNEDFILEYFEEKFYYNKPNWFGLGMIGCVLSHYFIYKDIVERKIPFTLVMEDDIVLLDAFTKVFVNNIIDKMKPLDIVLPFYQYFNTINLNSKDSVNIINEINLYNFKNPKLGSTGCYIITYETALNFYNNLKPINTAPDYWDVFYKRKYFNNLYLVYPFVIESMYSESDIGNIEIKNKFIKSIFNFLKKNNILFFRSLIDFRRKILFNKMRKVKVI